MSRRVAVFSIVFCLSGPAAAQTVCRLVEAPGGGGRQNLQCGAAVQVEGGPGAQLRAAQGGNSVEVAEGRVLTRVRNSSNSAGGEAPRNAGGGFEFQIRTPHAIASVRGTIWAVEVSSTGTAVYAKEGFVHVERVSDGAAVTLRCDEGVDIAPGQAGALVVRRWPRNRSNTLLAPFGLSGGCP